MTNEEAIKFLKSWYPIHPLKQEAKVMAIKALQESHEKGHIYYDEHSWERCSVCNECLSCGSVNFCEHCGADLRNIISE